MGSRLTDENALLNFAAAETTTVPAALEPTAIWSIVREAMTEENKHSFGQFPLRNQWQSSLGSPFDETQAKCTPI